MVRLESVEYDDEIFSYTDPLTQQKEERRRRVSSVIAKLKSGAKGKRRRAGNDAPPPLALKGGKGTIDPKIYNTNRGHLVALEFGGDEVSENIVPMWGGFNQHGKWRAFEEEIKKIVCGKENIKIKIICHYSSDQNIDQRIPISFEIISDEFVNSTIPHVKPCVSPISITKSDINLFHKIHQEFLSYKNEEIKKLYPKDFDGQPLRLPEKLSRYAIFDFAILTGLIKCPNNTKIKNFNFFSEEQRTLILNFNAWCNESYYKSDDAEDPVHTNGSLGQLLLGGDEQAPEIDHIFPRSKGGCNAFGNAQVISGELNKKKQAGYNNSEDEKKSEEYAAEAKKIRNLRSSSS